MDTLKQIVGLSALPAAVMDQIKLLNSADANHVLGQMASRLKHEADGNLKDIFNNALLRAKRDHTMLTFEMNRVERALSEAGVIPVILKGGAYVARNMAAAAGRRVSDLDILVAFEELEKVEEALLAAGWEPEETTDNEYDQDYYRQHMHELPPLRHAKRGTVLDVHHALLPRTSRFSVDVSKMMDAALQLPDHKLKTFSEIDIFIHSAVHGFADGALDVPIRTLVELFLIYNHLSGEDIDEIVSRATDLGAAVPVGMALWAVGRVFGVERASASSGELIKPYRYLIFKWAVLSKTRNDISAPFAKTFLYVRSHYLRMPFYLLFPHLIKKAIAWRPNSKTPSELPFP